MSLNFRLPILLFLPCLLVAQNPTANIIGVVRDVSGAVAPQAKIVLKGVDTGVLRETQSDANGAYAITNLAPGNYSIAAEKPGFQRMERHDISLVLDQTGRVDFTIRVGVVAESVEVTSALPPLNTETPAKGDVLAAREMQDLPLDGREVADLALLMPGVQEQAQGAIGSGFLANGARADNTNFIIDGISNRALRDSTMQARPTVDSMMEFKVQTTGYSAEYGRFAGATMTMVLKSGTNQLHGTLFEFVRNDVFDARGFFSPTKARARRNQFGAVFDGPVYLPKLYNGRNRTFFLANWESYRPRTKAENFSRTPTALERGGDFTQTVNPLGKPVVMVDPLSSGTCVSGMTGRCFSGNAIPKSRMDPIALKVMDYYPAENLPGQVNNFYAAAPNPSNWDNFTFKIDQRIGSADTISARAVQRFTRAISPFAGGPSGLFPDDTNQTDILAGLTYTRILTPTLVNEARFGFTRTDYIEASKMLGRNYTAQWGLAGSTGDPSVAGFPWFVVQNMMNIGNFQNSPLVYTLNSYQWADTATWAKGRHLVKVGGSVQRDQFFQPNSNNVRGSYNFSGSWTSVAFGDFELGLMNQFSRLVGSNRAYTFQTSVGAFIQDDFKVRPNLTLSLGLRYEFTTPIVDKYGRWASFLPEFGKIIVASDRTVPDLAQVVAKANLTAQVALARDVGLPQSLQFSYYKTLDPRVGFAWRPTADNRTVFRGGYGIYAASMLLGAVKNNLANVFPFSRAETYNRSNTNPLALTLQNPLGTSSSYSGVLTPSGYQDKPTPGYVQSWNLTIEREVGRGNAVEAGYVGSAGTHLCEWYNINQPLRIPGLLVNGSFPRPFPAFNDMTYWGFDAVSSYHSGSILFRKRIERGFFYRVNYVLGKSLDDASQIQASSDGGFGGVQDARNRRLDHGRSDWDRRHQVSMMFAYLTNSRHWALKGWQVTGTERIQSGQAFTVKTTNPNLGAGEAARPDRIAFGEPADPSPSMWYDKTAFPVVPTGSFRPGTSGRNILVGPRLVVGNLALVRHFPLHERFSAQFRVEIFNVFNHPNFNLPNTSVNTLAGGTITSAGAPRSMQFGMKIQF